MIWVAGDWRGQWLFYSEVAGVVGVSILLDETAWAAVKRGPKPSTHKWPILRLCHMRKGNVKGPVESRSWDPLESGLNFDWVPLPTSRSIVWEGKFHWLKVFDHKFHSNYWPAIQLCRQGVTTGKPGLKIKMRISKQNWEESSVTSHCRGHRFHRINAGKLLNS